MGVVCPGFESRIWQQGGGDTVKLLQVTLAHDGVESFPVQVGGFVCVPRGPPARKRPSMASENESGLE